MTRTSYHHGALRDALMDACLRLIETDGVAAVSMRKVARTAGVSTAAPYHHFADRAALLAALSEQGFRLLTADMVAARAAASTPLAALTAVAEAYVGFARTHPAHFALMFRPELYEPDRHPDTQAAGDAAFDVLSDAVADCAASGVLPTAQTDVLAVAWWGLAHGLASLWLDGKLDKFSAQRDTDATTLVEAIMRSFAALIAPSAPTALN